jgi:hypothetical protein
VQCLNVKTFCATRTKRFQCSVRSTPVRRRLSTPNRVHCARCDYTLQVEFDVDEQQGRKASSTWCDLHVTWASWVCKFRQNQSDIDRGRPAIRWSENKVTRGWHPLYFLDDGSRLRNRLSIWPCRMKVVLPVSAFVCALSADGQGMPPEIFRSREIEIKETQTTVVLNNANCTVLTVHCRP